MFVQDPYAKRIDAVIERRTPVMGGQPAPRVNGQFSTARGHRVIREKQLRMVAVQRLERFPVQVRLRFISRTVPSARFAEFDQADDIPASPALREFDFRNKPRVTVPAAPAVADANNWTGRGELPRLL